MAKVSGQDEMELLSRVRRGAPGAARALYDRYAGHLSAVCARYIPSGDDRKDILQESFIKIFSSLDRFEPRGDGSLRAWMSRIVVNESLRFLRGGVRFEALDCGEALPDTSDDPQVDMVPDDAINDMILALPAGYRMVFNLYVFEGKSHKEIAGMLGIGAGTSASQFFRARAALARMIRRYIKEHESDR